MSEQGEAKTSTTSETPPLIGNETKTEVKPEGEVKVEGAVETKPETEAPAPLAAADLKIPEGFTVDQPVMDKFLAVMNNAELDAKARGQALLDLQSEAMKEVSERGNKLWSDMQDKWQETARTEFGAGLEPMLGNISKLLDQYGGSAEQVKELRDVFTLTGAGNHPAMVRFLDNVGKPLRESAARSGAPTSQGRTAAEVLYPNQGRNT